MSSELDAIDMALNWLNEQGVDIEWAEYAAYYDVLGERHKFIVDRTTTIQQLYLLVDMYNGSSS